MRVYENKPLVDSLGCRGCSPREVGVKARRSLDYRLGTARQYRDPRGSAPLATGGSFYV